LRKIKNKMEATIQKIAGWALLVIGLLLIFWSVRTSYNIFTAKTSVPEIFKIEEQKIKADNQGQPDALQEQMQKMVNQAIAEQIKGFIPANTLPELLNLIAWSIFSGIFIFAGSAVSSLGIKLIKK